MNTKNKKQIRSILACILCVLALSIPAMAAEGGPGVAEDGTAIANTYDGTSRVIYAGGETASTETPVQETPGTTEEAATSSSDSPSTGHKGASLGMFTTTGYCNCSRCSGGFNLTYSGTVPKAKHTISADLSIFPIGTKLMIDDVIYTVEDMGSSVKGNWIDIFYGSHEEAVIHGMKTQEVFRVEE